MPNFILEARYKGLIGGVDEVGRGPWAGPVVAGAALFLDPESLPLFLKENINDSKKLSKMKRKVIYDQLISLDNFSYGIGVSSVVEIDELNILNATFLAMKRAVSNLSPRPHSLLIDGKVCPSFEDIDTYPVVGGDNQSLSIAAASIIAKVTRDHLMETLAIDYPSY